jgi:hypothetical protein
MKNKVIGIIIMLVGATIGIYHTFFVVPGVYEKLAKLAGYAETFTDNLAGIGGVTCLVVPFFICVALIWFGGFLFTKK